MEWIESLQWTALNASSLELFAEAYLLFNQVWRLWKRDQVKPLIKKVIVEFYETASWNVYSICFLLGKGLILGSFTNLYW
jgi:hypothetical protein